MTNQEKRFSVMEVGPFESLVKRDDEGMMKGKVFVGETLGLTGCEVSINSLPAGQSSPFVHAHKKNEELYIITGGNGSFFVDGHEFPIQEGSLVRVDPAGERALKAGDHDLYYICIQAEAGSLTAATAGDGMISKTKASWME